MTGSVFFDGILIGFSIAAPVGPIGVLCVQRTLAHGFTRGFLSGLGAACADAVYGVIGCAGAAAAAGISRTAADAAGLAGGTFLLWLGARMFRVPGTESGPPPSRGHAGAFLSAFLLTLSNPMTIVSFAAVFAGLGAAGNGAGAGGAAALIAGVFLGSASWWLFLGTVTARLGRGLGAGAMRVVSRCGGVIVAGFGLAAAGTAMARLLQ